MSIARRSIRAAMYSEARELRCSIVIYQRRAGQQALYYPALYGPQVYSTKHDVIDPESSECLEHVECARYTTPCCVTIPGVLSTKYVKRGRNPWVIISAVNVLFRCLKAV